MSWVVVPIAQEHIEGYCAAVDSVASEREYLAFLEGPPLERSRAFVMRNLREDHPHFVAVQDRRVIGWCDISRAELPVFAHSGVLGMGVVAAYRGRGIGEALARAALDRAWAAGLARVELTVRQANLGARALFEKLGFVAEGVKRNAVKVDGRYDDHVCMAVVRSTGASGSSLNADGVQGLPRGRASSGRRQVDSDETCQHPAIAIRKLEDPDWARVWMLMEPVLRAGETYAFARDIPEAQVRKLWVETPSATYLAQAEGGEVLGTYYIKPNQAGGGSHVCNCGYIVGESGRGQGVASLMCEHSQREATRLGFRAMQFNFVVSTNEGAVRLWRKLGFRIVGRLPEAFAHPKHGFVDAFVMFKRLET